ncbi:MAG: hypothetical protein A3J79_10540 [Elusimicrobia bacterium RIFOXYB2_FULL_62_6]|nr:MAG: hypothetical protein A3J79_10540 [Elusimicrobia bacterium RIFOXYB2_FULL_62_6]
MVKAAEPCELDLKSASELIGKKQLSPVELVSSCFSRIGALDAKLSAWTLLDEKGALAAAKRAEKELLAGKRRGPLHGIPVGIKDIFYTKGLRTEAGSRSMAGFVPSYDAAAVERLKAAGAVILGKTRTTEFAFLDPASTRNPWNTNHTPGGSSSGSAAAVAARMCPAALGSQTVGSILRPAAYNGVVGFKAQHGRVSAYGVVPLSWTLDHIGVLARSVEDAALVFRAIAGYDSRDPRSLDAAVPGAALKSRKPPRLGLAKGYFFAKAGAEARRSTEEAADKFRKAGAVVTEAVLPPALQTAAELNRLIMAVEAAAYHKKNFAAKPRLFRPGIAGLIEEGLAVPESKYKEALVLRLAACAEMARFLSRFDAVLTPGATGPAPKGLESTGDAAMQRPWSTLGVPTIALPAGLSRGGLPLGVQLAGRPFAEDRLLAAARWCEGVLGPGLKPRLG